MKIPFIKNKEEVPKALKKGLLPSQEFLRSGKQNFLVAFDTSALSKNLSRRNPIFALGFKFGIGIVAIFAVVASASAYADTANVSVENPLYPLKRLGETVQLILTPAPQKAEVQANFAVRREREIIDIQAKNPSSTLIPTLTSALGEDISSSLNSANTTQIKGRPLKALCAVFSGLGANISLHHDLVARFNKQCTENENVQSTTLNISTTSDMSAMGSEQSSTWTTDEHEDNHRAVTSSTVQVSSTIFISPIQPPKLRELSF